MSNKKQTEESKNTYTFTAPAPQHGKQVHPVKAILSGGISVV